MKTNRIRWIAFGSLASVLLAAGWGILLAGEHPKGSGSEPTGEHPKKKKKPVFDPPPRTEPTAPAPAPITMADLSKAIRAYVEKDAELKGGYFLLYDTVDKAPLLLKLDRVHEDRLSGLGDGVYFACVDLKTPEGAVYDVDIFMKQDGTRLDPTEITVHKKAGTARYGWKEEGGVWKKVEAGK